ncbi:MAG: prolipoprotein diacylglyceryl transferase [Candidatus Falkowbacteria bacterium]|nr:MAG: prolipoprotein diacylglyceryl transferase [Candidatus Falkowbacteria bacterium]
MLNWLHTFLPQPIIFNWGPLTLHWYGLFIVLGIIAAMLISFHLGKKYYQITANDIFDLAFWLIVAGVVGARLYDVLLQIPYYRLHPWQILQVWKGGMAIHGSIIAGLIVIFVWARAKKINFFKITALFVPGLALGQAIGRWGNYFNQEIFGLPTNLPWGIPIAVLNRPADYISFQHFQPTFLYESLGSLLIFATLYLLTIRFGKKQKLNLNFYIWLTTIYLILYSLLRFLLEFIRLDYAPLFLGLRFPQVMSLAIIISSFLLLIIKNHVFVKSQK